MTEPDDEQMGRYVDALAEQVPEVEPPFGAVLAAGRAAARRRTRLRTVVAGLAVAGTVLAVALVPGLVRGSDRLGPVTSSPSVPADVGPTAPDGMRLVGARGVVIAVPASWAQEPQPSCAAPDHPYYDLTEQNPPAYYCPLIRSADRQAVSRLDIDAYASAHSVAPQKLTCSHSGCLQSWLVDGTLFTATVVASTSADARAQLAAMGQTIQRLPTGYTTVPLWPLVTTHLSRHTIGSGPMSPAGYLGVLEQAGLSGVLGREPKDDPRATDPAQGTVVGAGSQVTLGSAAATPTVPPGMRLVGRDGYAIAVPETWETRVPGVCGVRPVAGDYVDLVDRSYPVPCPADPVVPGAVPSSHLDIGPATSAAESGHCTAAMCTHRWPFGGVLFTVTVYGSDAQTLIDRMRSSLQALPDGWTTVPEWPLQEQQTSDGFSITAISADDYAGLVSGSGLTPVQGGHPPPDADPRVTDPSEASVVPAGSAVTVQPGSTSSPSTPASAAPSAPSGLKLVGMNGVAIGVPTPWTQGRKRECGLLPDNDSYYLDVRDQGLRNVAPSCMPTPPGPHDPDHLVVGPVGERLGSQYLPRPQGDGVVCDGQYCAGQWTDTTAGVRFLATLSGPDARTTLETMGASIQALPEGWTTVPAWPVGWRDAHPGVTYAPIPQADYVQLLRSAGLSTVDTSGVAGGQPLVSPAEGAVVRQGAQVAVSGGR